MDLEVKIFPFRNSFQSFNQLLQALPSCSQCDSTRKFCCKDHSSQTQDPMHQRLGEKLLPSSLLRQTRCQASQTNTRLPSCIVGTHNRVLESNAETMALPDTMLTLLLANCDPNELGSQGISPLCQALKFGDARAVSQLLRHHANPLCELGHSEPIFMAVICKD